MQITEIAIGENQWKFVRGDRTLLLDAAGGIHNYTEEGTTNEWSICWEDDGWTVYDHQGPYGDEFVIGHFDDDDAGYDVAEKFLFAHIFEQA